MALDYAKHFYESKAWRACRKGFISYRINVDGGKCQRCHDRLGYIVHHKTHLTPKNINDPDIALNWDNLQYVCNQCHEEIHDRVGGKGRIIFDDDGNVAGMRQPHRKFWR